jgi:hypothetical protein
LSGYFQEWGNLILYGAVLLSVVWLFFKFLETKIGKTIEKGVSTAANPIARRYESLSFNVRNVIGWLAIVFYCLSIVTIFIWMES